MLSKGTCVKVVLFCLLAVAAQTLFRILLLLGVFSHYYPHHPGQCKRIEGMQLGSENFYTLPDGKTFITSGLRQLNWGDVNEEHYRINKIKGRLYLFDFKKSEKGVTELKIIPSSQLNLDVFAPHGISVWEDKKTGHHIVFVVNHLLEPPRVDRIEKFVYDPEKQELQHVASFSDQSMKVVNDVQATGENSFYFTNYQYFTSRLGMKVETFLQLELTEVIYFDGNTYRMVADGMKSPNGITMSNDGLYVYISASLNKELRVFKRNKDNSLTLQQIFPLETVLDNPLVDPKTGDIYGGCHPIGYKVLAHMEDPVRHTAPSQVLHFRVKDGNITSVQELMYDEGSLISAATAAMVFDRKLLVGSIFHSLVLCDVVVPL